MTLPAERFSTRALPACPQPPASAYDLVILDLDGVVYIGPAAVPGAAQALRDARELGVGVCFVTNNASRPAKAVAHHLTSLGIAATTEDVLTSAQVAAALLRRRLADGDAVLVVGGEGLDTALVEVGLTPVRSMDAHPRAVVQGFHPDIGWRQLAEGTRAVSSGLPWVATNLDLTVPTPFGPAPGNGSLVNLVAVAAGRRPDAVAGKPRPEPFQEAVTRYGARIPLVVGDRLDTDLEGARAAGIDGLLVLTGVSGVTDVLLCPPSRRPTLIGRDLRALLHPHPGVLLAPADGSSPGAVDCVARCRGAQVRVRRADGLITVEADGADAVDLLRAAAVAVWAWADSAEPVGVDAGPVVDAVRRLEPGVAWAR